MSAVKASSNGSKGFNSQAPILSHLLTHGISADVKGLYTALYAVLGLSYDETIDEWDGPGAGATLQLSYAPKVRMGQVPVIRELLDGVPVSPTTGTIAQPGGAGTPWFYTPAQAPNASTAAVVTGAASLATASLYSTPNPGGAPTHGTLNGLTVILTVNGVLKTLTLNDPLNPINPPYVTTPTSVPAVQHTLLSQLNEAFPGLTATINGSNFLVLTDNLKGSTQSIVVGAGTANTLLGLTAGTTSGTGHSYAVVYEVDGTQIPNANVPVTGGTYAGGPGTGSPVQIED